MNSYALVYTFLAIAIGAMIFVIGTPWLTPKPRKIDRKKTQVDINTTHG